jgi:hypothetical protein
MTAMLRKQGLDPRQCMIPKTLSPDLIRGWGPVFGKGHAPPIKKSGMTNRTKIIRL